MNQLCVCTIKTPNEELKCCYDLYSIFLVIGYLILRENYFKLSVYILKSQPQ